MGFEWLTGKKKPKTRHKRDADPSTDRVLDDPNGDAPNVKNLFEKFEGISGSEKVRYCVLRLRDDNNYYQVAMLPPPCSIQQIANKYGGGRFKVNAHVNGTVRGSEHFFIDPDVYPPYTRKDDKQPGGGVEGKIDKLIALITLQVEASLKGTNGNSETEAQMIDRVIKYKELFGIGNGHNGESNMAAIKTGIELAKKAAGGDKNIYDILESQLPAALETINKIAEARRGGG